MRGGTDRGEVVRGGVVRGRPAVRGRAGAGRPTAALLLVFALALGAAGCGVSDDGAASSADRTTTTAADGTATTQAGGTTTPDDDTTTTSGGFEQEYREGTCTIDWSTIDWEGDAQTAVDAYQEGFDMCEDLLGANFDLAFTVAFFPSIVIGDFANFDFVTPDTPEGEVERLEGDHAHQMATIAVEVVGTDPCTGDEDDDVVTMVLTARPEADPAPWSAETLARGVQQFAVDAKEDGLTMEPAAVLPGGGTLIVGTGYGEDDCSVAWAVQGDNASMVIAHTRDLAADRAADAVS